MTRLSIEKLMSEVKKTYVISNSLTEEQKRSLQECNYKALAEAALAYANNGFKVLPCSASRKNPLVKNGYKDATIDEEIIRQWWSKFPGSAIGLVTGYDSGLFVVDLDEGIDKFGKKKNGIANYEDLCSQYGYEISTLRVRTAHGGLHLYFKMPMELDIRNSESKIAPYIDIRGNGGYVIAYPSILDGIGLYKCEIPIIEPADAPQWLLDLIMSGKPKKTVFHDCNPSSDLNNGKLHPYVKKALNDECAKVASAQEGQRNSQLNTSAFALGQLVAGNVLPEDIARKKLEQAADQCGLIDDPKDGGKKSQRTIESGLTAGMKEPRGIPEKKVSTNYDPQASSKTQYILPLPPKVPLHVFPKQIKNLLEEVSMVTSTTKSLSVAAFIAMVSACLGQSRALYVKKGFMVCPNLYLLIVCVSGVGKSPVAKIFFKHIDDVEEQKYREWQEALREYSRQLEIYNANMKKKDFDVSSMIEPQCPVREQVYIEKATLEATIDALSENPRGILIKSDEFSTILSGRGRFTRGDTMEMTALFNSAYDQSPFKSNTRTSKNVYIKRPSLSIFGEIQTDILFECVSSSDQASGFVPRCTLIRAEDEKASLWTDIELSDENEELVRNITSFLLHLECDSDDNGNVKPRCNGLKLNAKEYFVEWYNKMGRYAYWSENKDRYSSYIKKIRVQGIKMILIFHYIKAAIGEVCEDDSVSIDTTKSALEFTEYILKNNIQVVNMLSVKPDSSDTKLVNMTPIERRIMNAIIRHEDDIVNAGFIVSNEWLSEIVNEYSGDVISPESIGKACVKLGLPSIHRKKRGRVISSPAINKFKETVATVESVEGIDISEFSMHNELSSNCSELSLDVLLSTGNRINDSSESHVSFPQNSMVDAETTETTVSTDILPIDFENKDDVVVV